MRPVASPVCVDTGERIWCARFGPGPGVSDIFREIDEELRRDNLLQLWSRYGRYIVMVAAAAVLLAAGFVLWRNHELAERQAQSGRYAAAVGLARQNKDAEAAQVFGQIAREGGGYGELAAFQQAALLAKTGDHKGAIAIYDRVAGDGDVGANFRNLARLLSAMQALPDADPKTVIGELAPLTAKDSPWRPTALELTAVADLKAGDRKAAADIYKGLADDPATPDALRARAAEMTAALAP